MGRQPWIVFQVMRTAEALTPRHGLAVYFYVTVAVYLMLSIALIAILRRIATGPTPADVELTDPAPREHTSSTHAPTPSAI